MRTCTLFNKVEIIPGCYEDYKKLSCYHYRDNGPGQISRIFAIKPKADSFLRTDTIGVIVYSTPNPGLELRNIATNNFFVGFDRATQISLLNKYIRRISRVIIEPRFRGLGLATRLVRETMPLMNFPIIEASAIMGEVNPFLEKAGMIAFHAPEKLSTARIIIALETVGIKKSLFAQPNQVQEILGQLSPDMAEFIESEFRRFLQSYGDKRYSRPAAARTKYILNKLTARPVYYIWFNQNQ
jgi:hypothetical protein